MRKVAKIALGVLLLGSVIALMEFISDRVSRDEDNWRLSSDKWFQRDFKPGEGK